MRFLMINFKLIKTLITILFFYTTILFATVLENNQKDLIYSTKHGDSILLISGENFKKTEPENWISYKNRFFCTLCKKWEWNIRNPCAVKSQSGIIGRDAPFYSV